MRGLAKPIILQQNDMTSKKFEESRRRMKMIMTFFLNMFNY